MIRQQVVLFLVVICLLKVIDAETKNQVKIVFGGDVEFTRIFKHLHNVRNCSYVGTLTNLKSYTKDADFFIVNLITTLRSSESAILKPETKTGAMESDASVVDALKHIGIDYVNLAHEHIGDYGESGIKNTMMILEKNGIHYFGLNFENDPYSRQLPMVLEQNGVKIGILGFCETPECETSRLNSKVGAAMLNISNTITEIKSLRKAGCDVVILYVNWDIEYTSIIGGRPLLDIRYLLRGVKIDAIIGTHPHVTHKHWYLNDTLIASSLGNLLKAPYLYASENFNDDGNVTKIAYYENIWHKQSLVMKDETSLGRLLKVTFDRNGIVKQHTQYLNTEISSTEQHCLVTRKADDSDWRTICEKGDPECTGTPYCNYLQCDNEDPLPVELGLETRSN